MFCRPVCRVTTAHINTTIYSTSNTYPGTNQGYYVVVAYSEYPQPSPQQVVRLLRVCRSEDVRKQLVLTMARPLYRGWGHPGALEDVWSFIASAVSTEYSFACSHRQVVDVIEVPRSLMHWPDTIRFGKSSDGCQKAAACAFRSAC